MLCCLLASENLSKKLCTFTTLHFISQQMNYSVYLLCPMIGVTTFWPLLYLLNHSWKTPAALYCQLLGQLSCYASWHQICFKLPIVKSFSILFTLQFNLQSKKNIERPIYKPLPKLSYVHSSASFERPIFQKKKNKYLHGCTILQAVLNHILKDDMSCNISLRKSQLIRNVSDLHTNGNFVQEM